MSKNQIAIICDGKEISYGMNLLHLLKYDDVEKQITFVNEGAEGFELDIYSVGVYKRAGIPKTAIKIFIGSALQQRKGDELMPVFNQHGITVMSNKKEIGITVNPLLLDEQAYDAFICFANKVAESFMETAQIYAEHVSKYCDNWIKKSFIPIQAKGLFGNKTNIKNRTQQLYDCAAYVVFMNCLRDLIDGKKE